MEADEQLRRHAYDLLRTDPPYLRGMIERPGYVPSVALEEVFGRLPWARRVPIADVEQQIKLALHKVLLRRAETSAKAEAERQARERAIKEHPPRNAAIYARRKAGATYRAIAREFGLSAARVSNICATQERLKSRQRRFAMTEDWTPERQYQEMQREISHAP